MENTERQADDSVVNFDSHDIRATQSKKSPTYFVNVDKPREKLPKAKKRKIIIICVSIISAIVATLIAILIIKKMQPTATEQQIQALNNELPLLNAEASAYGQDDGRSFSEIETDYKRIISQNLDQSITIEAIYSLGIFYFNQAMPEQAISLLNDALKNKQLSLSNQYVLLSGLDYFYQELNDIENRTAIVRRITQLDDFELSSGEWSLSKKYYLAELCNLTQDEGCETNE